MTHASPILKSSRHAIHLTGDLREPAGPLYKYRFLVTYKKLSARMRCFIGEANASRERLESVVEALRQLLALEIFRDLLKAEGFTVIPGMLADGIAGRTVSVPGTKPNQREPSRQLIGGICPEVLDLLQDCVAPPKMFGLLRQVLPSRQIEMVEVMIALERVKLDTARVFIALTPQSQFAGPSTPRKQFAGIDAAQFAAMAANFAELSRAFQHAAGHHGPCSLALVAARGYLDRLMENARVVRYLALNCPEQLADFQTVLETDRPANRGAGRSESQRH
ncbi:plasmid partitioning protein RepB C-terminal domain-containing protein [Mesorhizobium sp. VK4C]|uniref:plasmid partitioning protein RepB C-terminal domain-containing protein n=1 Tax=Mesorhizobium captivum TaxID=3072319 RepID=UPI002A24B64F|nr:plasmid partitioning protein RepB C-terminal domain-containing protein [Mesorhizobium sp. VK4C]MDX8500615.1 plasmid partitioning protein RepB C-terminal domain-containing protein [Mesorhizobium sp. VK4C]